MPLAFIYFCIKIVLVNLSIKKGRIRMYGQLSVLTNNPKALIVFSLFLLFNLFPYIFKVAFEDWFKDLGTLEKILTLIAASVLILGIIVVLISLYLFGHP